LKSSSFHSKAAVAALGVALIHNAGAQDAAAQPSVLAQANPNGPLPEVVVSASRGEQMLRDALPATTVINEERIRNSQAPDVVTLLRQEAGVEVVQNGGIGTNASVFMRGGSSNQTLILIDGVQMNSQTLGTTAIQNILPARIERIEIVRGNVSALYGSQAMGGVIQIFTKHGGGEPSLSGSVQLGSRNTRSAAAGFSGKTGDTRYALNVSSFSTSNFSSLDPNATAAAPRRVNPDNDPYNNQSASGNISHDISDKVQVGANFYRTESHLNYDSAGSTTNKPSDTHYGDSFSEAASAYVRAQVLPIWRSTLSYARGRDYSKSYTNAVATAPISSLNTQWAWKNDVRVADGHKINLAYESQRIGIDSQTAFIRNARNIESYVAGYNGEVDRWQGQINWRQDRFSDFGTKGTYYSALGYSITPEWKVIGSISTAFRAPTFNNLFFPNFGNPNLKPEQARSHEVALQWAQDSHLARLTYFKTRYTDMIIDNNPSAGNISRAQVDGFELTYTGKLMGFDLRASATAQNPWDTVNQVQLQRVAKRFGSLGVGRSWGAWRFGVDWRSSGDRRDFLVTSSTTPTTLASYHVFDLTASYAIDKRWTVAARVENAFDQKYQLAQGFNTAPTGVFVSLSYR
jgi:vitamin B12 transporter